MDKTQYYKRQISFTEWFEQIDHARTNEMREEDNEKRERLKVLNEMIGLPYDKPVQFNAVDITNDTPAFQNYLAGHGDDLCAMRVIPRNPSLSKLRIRGKSVSDSLNWFSEQAINPVDYRVDFVPHSEHTLWSTCFVVNENGIFGEIIGDAHTHLTQGFYESATPIAFYHDWQVWRMTQSDADALEHLKGITDLLRVESSETRQRLRDVLQTKFSHGHLCGYFETVAAEDYGIWFIDYNRVLGDLYQNFVPFFPENTTSSLNTFGGTPACWGIARGMVRIVLEENISEQEFEDGDVLVCDMTSPLYVPLMKKAGAIVTDRGGILSHAAIVNRELKKPCITNTKNATRVLKDGDKVEVDADEGIVKKLA